MSVSAGNDLSCMYNINGSVNGSVNGIVTLSSQGGCPSEWLCNQNVTVRAYLEKNTLYGSCLQRSHHSLVTTVTQLDSAQCKQDIWFSG